MRTQRIPDAVRRGRATSLREGLEIEADLTTLAFQTADAAEGMTAFLEERKPVSVIVEPIPRL